MSEHRDYVKRYNAEQIECNDCGARIRRANLARQAQQHASSRSTSVSSLLCRAARCDAEQQFDSRTSSQERLDVRSTASADARHGSAGRSRLEQGEARYGGLSFSEYLIAGAAANAVMEQHEIYIVAQLCGYLQDQYPQLPTEARPYVVTAAAAGAQHAARIHFFAEVHQTIHSPEERQRVAGARSALASWNIGLREDPAFKPMTTSTTTVHESMRSTTDNSGGPARVDKQLSVSPGRNQRVNSVILSAPHNPDLPASSTRVAEPSEADATQDTTCIVGANGCATLLDQLGFPVDRDHSNASCQQVLAMALQQNEIDQAVAFFPAVDDPPPSFGAHACTDINMIVQSVEDTTGQRASATATLIDTSETFVSMPALTVVVTGEDRGAADPLPENQDEGRTRLSSSTGMSTDVISDVKKRAGSAQAAEIIKNNGAGGVQAAGVAQKRGGDDSQKAVTGDKENCGDDAQETMDITEGKSETRSNPAKEVGKGVTRIKTIKGTHDSSKRTTCEQPLPAAKDKHENSDKRLEPARNGTTSADATRRHTMRSRIVPPSPAGTKPSTVSESAAQPPAARRTLCRNRKSRGASRPTGSREIDIYTTACHSKKTDITDTGTTISH